MRARLLASLAVAAAVAAPLAGCGDKQSVIKSADTEAAFLDLGQLRYQVEISRQLNPADVEDRTYLQGVGPAQAVLRPGESWFAVFMRVENDYKRPKTAATDFELTDTQGTTYRPVPIARTNPFAYQGGKVGGGGGTLPQAGSVAQLNQSVDGLLVLFKVKTASFDNRPLVLKIFGPTVPQDEVTVDLDV